MKNLQSDRSFSDGSMDKDTDERYLPSYLINKEHKMKCTISSISEEMNDTIKNMEEPFFNRDDNI